MMQKEDEDEVSLNNKKVQKMKIDDNITEKAEPEPKKKKNKANILRGTGDRDIKCYIPVGQKSQFSKTMKDKSQYQFS